MDPQKWILFKWMFPLHIMFNNSKGYLMSNGEAECGPTSYREYIIPTLMFNFCIWTTLTYLANKLVVVRMTFFRVHLVNFSYQSIHLLENKCN